MSIQIKKYSNYDDYISHQKSKADHGTHLYKELRTTLWESDCEGFRLNFAPHLNIIKQSTTALCLGARTGQEVHVLREMGLDAIGIDLVDTPPLVVKGDVHYLTFKDESYDFIFSNIFDHVLYPDKFVAGVKRVLKPGGYCLLHLSVSERGHPDNDQWASCNVSSSTQVAGMFGVGYEVIEDKPLNQPNWPTYWTLLIHKVYYS